MREIGKNYDLHHREKIERQIIGTLLAHNKDENIKEVVFKHNVKVTDFYFVICQEVFNAILECYNRNILPTPVAILQFRPDKYRYNNSSEFDFEVVTMLERGTVTGSTLEHDIFFLKQYVLMEFWNIQAHDILYGNWNGRDVLQVGDTIIKEYENLFKRMTNGLKVDNAEDDYASEISVKVLNKLGGKRVGVPTTVDCIDKFMYAYSPGELIVIAGRPGMGKTTFSLISAWNASQKGHPIIFYSLEMPKNQLKSKIISLETGIPYKDIKSGNLTPEQLNIVIQWNKYIDERSNFIIIDKIKYIEDISEKTRALVQEKNVKMIVIDYIQRCKTKSGATLRESITEISRECKSIAKDNYIPVMALSQLSRAVEARIPPRPKLADLKESGSIEEDADVVAFLYRQAYYDEQKGSPVHISELFHTEFIFGKGRDIGTGTVDIYLDAINMKIHQYSIAGDYTNFGITTETKQ